MEKVEVKSKLTLLNFDQERFKASCERYNLSLVILHGSYAKGTVVPKSDIDIGFLGEADIVKEKYLDILRDLSNFFGDRFDPLILNGAEPMIACQVALNGLPLYEKTRGLFDAFKVHCLSRYMDTKKFRILEKEYIKSAIKEM